jgi:uncharacterized phage protein (TIGR02220 family)
MRVNVDSKDLPDPRFMKLGLALGTSRFDALGRCVHVWAYALGRRSPLLSSDDIDAIAERIGFTEALIRAGLATADGDHVRLSGIADRLDWLLVQDRKRELALEAKRAQLGLSRQAPAGVPADVPGDAPREVSGDIPNDPDPDPDPDLRDVRAGDRVRVLAETGIAEINRIAGTRYQSDSKETLAACRKLAKAGITSERLRDAIAHVARPWVGTKLADAIRPSTLLQLKRVRDALEDIDARKPIASAATHRPAIGDDVVCLDGGLLRIAEAT